MLSVECNLVAWLNADDESPFAAWNNGQGISPRNLSDRLKAFDITPGTRRFGAKTERAYELGWFEAAFDAYLPEPAETAITQ